MRGIRARQERVYTYSARAAKGIRGRSRELLWRDQKHASRKLTICFAQESGNVRLTRYDSRSRFFAAFGRAQKSRRKNVLMFCEKVPGGHVSCAQDAHIEPSFSHAPSCCACTT